MASVLALLAGCSGGGSSSAKTPTSTVEAPTPQSTPPTQLPARPSGSGTPRSAPPSLAEETASAGTPQPPLPGRPEGTPDPVLRAGAPAPAQRVRAAAGTFQSGAGYPDGLSVAVGQVTNSVATQTGPGSVTGQAVTRLSVRIGNGAGPALDVNNVVVTLAYGPAQTHAQPVYDQQVQDFAGSVAPGQTATATYAFAVPVDQRRGLHVYVDVDARHAPALLTGDA